jgi:DNA polymerase-3 subunit alpha
MESGAAAWRIARTRNERFELTLPVVNLRARSSYSRNNVALAANVAKTLPKLAAKADQPAMGLIDLNTLAGAYEFSSTARKEGVQPIVGVDFTTDEGLITLIAENGTGWTNLLKITRAQHSGPLLGVTLDEVIEHAEGLVMLAGERLDQARHRRVSRFSVP